MIILTEKGKQAVAHYICEAEAKRKEILDAHKDTADETDLPTEDAILCDIAFWEEDGEYFNCWCVTDNYSTDYPLHLVNGIHYERK